MIIGNFARIFWISSRRSTRTLAWGRAGTETVGRSSSSSSPSLFSCSRRFFVGGGGGTNFSAVEDDKAWRICSSLIVGSSSSSSVELDWTSGIDADAAERFFAFERGNETFESFSSVLPEFSVDLHRRTTTSRNETTKIDQLYFFVLFPICLIEWNKANSSELIWTSLNWLSRSTR